MKGVLYCCYQQVRSMSYLDAHQTMSSMAVSVAGNWAQWGVVRGCCRVWSKRSQVYCSIKHVTANHLDEMWVMQITTMRKASRTLPYVWGGANWKCFTLFACVLLHVDITLHIILQHWTSEVGQASDCMKLLLHSESGRRRIWIHPDTLWHQPWILWGVACA